MFGFELLSSSIELLLVPVITVFYYLGNLKTPGLTLFFISYSIGDLANILDFNKVSDWSYYLCNTLYIIAYLGLISYVSKQLNLLQLIKKNKLDLFVLLLLAIGMTYVLVTIILLVDFDSDNIGLIHFVEFSFSIILIILMMLSYFKYIQHTSRKFFLLFLGCLCLVFSELVLVGYYYIAEYVFISYISTILYVTAIFLLYYHTLINHESFIETT
ncbi:hypothetical protein [Lacinutrix sp. MedPE-SW]|uniref:hypothetical protein n=1 Tax=Lacinutrix sp. MedPE-SW TaxID=1860087 RepID=UPI0025BF0FC8|nr:hypothetical protein [Lacinutrix sp. MedPE-SW]